MKIFSPTRVFRKSTSLILAAIYVIPLSGCGATQKIDASTTLTCTMFTNPDEYRVMVLMDIAQGGRNVDKYIDSLVRDLKYPGVEDSEESLSIKDEFATALYSFADAYVSNDEAQQKTASANLTTVTSTLKTVCETLGMDYSAIERN